MNQTETLIIGASISGLASAASLQKQGIGYILIEKKSAIAAPWRNHYHRLHLHTNKRISSLPYKKFGHSIPRYPSRQQVVDYLEDYQKEFDIRPVFDTEAISVRKEAGYWLTHTNNGSFQSKYIIMATGPFSKPRPVYFKGMETFPGQIMHSYDYKTGQDFKGQTVLVVGFGNSACEIALDLYEQGALASLSVRSPVNIIPRDLLGIPILEISQLLSRLPPLAADIISAPLLRLCLGDITRLGLQKMPYGPFRQIQRDGKVPVLDIGTLKHIRKGLINLCGGIDHIENSQVCFADGGKTSFDAIIASIGYHPDFTMIPGLDKERFGDLRLTTGRQKYFGKDGLYFCGFRIAPTGQIREIARDAQKIARDIAEKKLSKKQV